METYVGEEEVEFASEHERDGFESDDFAHAGDGAESDLGYIHEFTPKHAYEMKNNILSGISLGAWLELLYRRCRTHPMCPCARVPACPRARACFVSSLLLMSFPFSFASLGRLGCVVGHCLGYGDILFLRPIQ